MKEIAKIFRFFYGKKSKFLRRHFLIEFVNEKNHFVEHSPFAFTTNFAINCCVNKNFHLEIVYLYRNILKKKSLNIAKN